MKGTWPKFLILLFLVFVLATTFACTRKAKIDGLTFNLKISPETVTDFLTIKMDYNIKLDKDFAGFTSDYTMFVHFWRINNKEMLLQDDHQPLGGTQNWKKGETIAYSRTLFIPQFLNEFDMDFEGYEEIKLSIGLFNPKAKDDKIILYEKKISIQPASVNAPEIIYGEGWYDLEPDIHSTDVYYKSWRWTGPLAECSIENPKKPYTLIIKGKVNKDAFADQRLAFLINGTLLDEFIPSEAKFSKEYTVTPQMTGDSDEFTLMIKADKSFVPAKLDPASKDNRELGVQISFLYFREKL